MFFSNYFHRMLQNRPVKVSIAAAATCVIFLPFAVESHKSYWSGCIQVRWCFGSKVFFASALMIFLVQYFFEICSNFFPLTLRSGLKSIGNQRCKK